MTTGWRDRGQAAVEFAIALPLVVVLVLGVIQVAVVARDQIAIELAARAGARAAAVAAAPANAARTAANGATTLTPIDVTTTSTADRVVVAVKFTSRNRLPILGLVIGDVELSASVEMAREPP
ncbi:MAG: TadE/TadG family type IV pilus assembly protein [Ilumatobacteraceae bacterium]